MLQYIIWEIISMMTKAYFSSTFCLLSVVAIISCSKKKEDPDNDAVMSNHYLTSCEYGPRKRNTRTRSRTRSRKSSKRSSKRSSPDPRDIELSMEPLDLNERSRETKPPQGKRKAGSKGKVPLPQTMPMLSTEDPLSRPPAPINNKTTETQDKPSPSCLKSQQ